MKTEPEKIFITESENRLRRCAACGAEAARLGARFCLVCGKFLGEDYQPLDNLRASYKMQSQSTEIYASSEIPSARVDLYRQNTNALSDTARACLVYSLVPYLGILFVPFAVITGLAGYIYALRKPEAGGKNLALSSCGLSFVVLGLQIFLWWLLYVVPRTPHL